jgi:hypothetical protein
MSDELPSSAQLLRFVAVPAFVGEDGGAPRWEAFKPSPDDAADALNRSIRVRVSVWHLGATTREQAEDFRRAAEIRASMPPKKWRPFALHVSAVASARQAWQLPAVRVVRDPPTDPVEAKHPAAHAHCGIEGLDKQNGESKGDWQKRLASLTATLVSLDGLPVARTRD